MSVIRKIFGFLIDSIQSLLLAAAVFLVIYVFFFRPFQVSGQSMYPTFNDGQYILTNIVFLNFEGPKLGDTVVFKAPNDPEKDFIKRIIGIEGDRIYIKDGKVYRNGKLLDESAYLKPDLFTGPEAFLAEREEVTVPPDSYFVLGDNRPHSADSREWGFIPIKNIIGKSYFLYWPLNEMRLIKNPYER